MKKKTETLKENLLRVQQALEENRTQTTEALKENLLRMQQQLEDNRNQTIEELNNSRKSDDTDDYVDKYVHEPIALVFTRIFVKYGVSPNAVTILSMVFGVAGGILFFPQNRLLNLLGIVLQIFAAVLDCSDGQVARMTGKCTKLGRVLDGTVDGLNFCAVYIALALRLMNEPVPFCGGALWNGWIWPVVAFCGIVSHASQARMADYYRVVHLFFRKGNELPRTSEIREEYLAATGEENLGNRLWLRGYVFYTGLQEKATPRLQRLLRAIEENGGTVPYGADTAYWEQSHRIIQLTNLLTFSLRAYLLYILLLAGWYVWYFPFIILVLGIMKHEMIRRYERIADDVRERFFGPEKEA